MPIHLCKLIAHDIHHVYKFAVPHSGLQTFVMSYCVDSHSSSSLLATIVDIVPRVLVFSDRNMDKVELRDRVYSRHTLFAVHATASRQLPHLARSLTKVSAVELVLSFLHQKVVTSLGTSCSVHNVG